MEFPDTTKKYGPHKYPDDHPKGWGYCLYGCGCYMGPAKTEPGTLKHIHREPIGIDSLGECPGNPLEGERLGGDEDQRVIVDRRLRNLTVQAQEAEQALRDIKQRLSLLPASVWGDGATP